MRKKKLLFLILEFLIVILIQNLTLKLFFSLFILLLFIIFFHFKTLSELKCSLKNENIILRDAYFLFTDKFIVNLDVFNKFKLKYMDIVSYETKWSWRFVYFNRVLYLYTFDNKIYKVLLYRTKFPRLSLEEHNEKIVLKILKRKIDICNK